MLYIQGGCETQILTSTHPMLKGKQHYMIYAPFGKLSLFQDPDAKPFYQGRAVSRGIKCDVWQQKRINWPPGNVTELIWRWYFTQTDWKENVEAQPV